MSDVHFLSCYLYSGDLCSTLKWRDITIGVFDQRWNGNSYTALVGICLPSRQLAHALFLKRSENKMVIDSRSTLAAISIAAVRVCRFNVHDLLLIKPNHSLVLLTHGLREIPVQLRTPGVLNGVLALKDGVKSSVTVSFVNGSTTRITVDLTPKDKLTQEALLLLSLTLPADLFFTLHHKFLHNWSLKDYSSVDNVTFATFKEALLETLQIMDNKRFSYLSAAQAGMKWQNLGSTSSFSRYQSDPALRRLKLPPVSRNTGKKDRWPNDHAAIVLQEMHYLGLNLWINIRRHKDLVTLVDLIITIGTEIRPEWADFWKRVCYDPTQEWPNPKQVREASLTNRLPFWPPDILSTIYNRMNNPEWSTPWPSTMKRATMFELTPSMVMGAGEPLKDSRNLLQVYFALVDPRTADSRKRAEKAILLLTKLLGAKGGQEFIDNLPIGLAAPLKEAARACQLNPSGDWPVDVFTLIGRNDLVESVRRGPDLMFDYGYRSVKEYLVSLALMYRHVDIEMLALDRTRMLSASQSTSMLKTYGKRFPER